MRFTDLSDHSLQLILECLPLLKQLRLVLVNSRWHRLIISLCRQRHTLVLSCRQFLAEIPSIRIVCLPYASFDDALLLGEPDQVRKNNTFATIKRLFPNVRYFEYKHQELFCRELISLLAHWRHNLVSIKLTIVKSEKVEITQYLTYFKLF